MQSLASVVLLPGYFCAGRNVTKVKRNTQSSCILQIVQPGFFCGKQSLGKSQDSEASGLSSYFPGVGVVALCSFCSLEVWSYSSQATLGWMQFVGKIQSIIWAVLVPKPGSFSALQFICFSVQQKTATEVSVSLISFSPDTMIFLN